YRIGLEGRIHTEDGRGYTTRLLRSFIYGREEDEFTLESSDMEGDCLILNFSRTPRLSSFSEHFSISPDTEYFCDLLGTTVKIQPKTPWQINTRYTWSIRNMESADGHIMKKYYSAAFSGSDDFEIPCLAELCPVNRQFSSGPPYLWKWGTELDGSLENHEGIGFIFSKPMDHASLRSGISFYPAIKGYFEDAGEDSIVFFPEEEYRLGTEYRITLSAAVKDSLGLAFFEELHYYFSSAHHWLEVEKLSLDSGSLPLEPGGIPQDHFLLPAEPPGLELRIAFSRAIPPGRRRAAADAVSLSVLFPASAHSPVLVSVQWQDGGALLSMKFKDLSPSVTGVDNYYQIKILSGESGPVSDSGEYLKEDLWYVIRAR
ncbi:MAG: Ig-like domain-containing protein, partial [Treponema sp.]|nr:Ig-like domain-containing protein [Treponema sp.]